MLFLITLIPFTSIIPGIMTSNEDLIQGEKAEKMLNSPVSSEGEEEYDDCSYGSEFQPPDLAQGFVKVHETCCRARYRVSRASKDSPYCICLNKSTCRSLAGGQHPVLRGGQRADPGIYEGIFSARGKLLAAKSGTRCTPASIKKVFVERRGSDRTQATAIKGLSFEDPPGGLSSGGLSRSSLSISQAEDLVAEMDQEFEGDVSGALEKNPTGHNATFLGVLSSLVKQIEKLDDGLKKRDAANTTILHELKETSGREDRGRRGILHPPS